MKVRQYHSLPEKISAVLLLFSWSIAQNGSQVSTSREQYSGLKTLKIYSYNYQHKEEVYTQELAEILRVDYNRYGNTTDSSRLDSTGNLLEQVYFLYNPDGHLIEKKYFNSDNELVQVQSFVYDSNWVCLEKTWKDTNDTVTKSIAYRYHTPGLFAEIVTRIDTSYEKIIFRYDDNNRLLEKRWYDQSGNLRRKAEFSVDGKPTGILLYKPDGSLHWEYIYNLPTRTGVREIHITNDQVIETKTEFLHDTHARCTEMNQYDEAEKLVYRIVYQYNRQGDFSNIEEYDNSGQLQSRVAYEYEKNGRLLSTHSVFIDNSGGELVQVPTGFELYEYSDY